MRTRLLAGRRGFALLIAVIFMSVMLTFGLSLASLGYKQQVLASAAIESQYAFYAADAALECALYADQQQDLFAYPADITEAPVISCPSVTNISAGVLSYTTSPEQWIITNRLSLDAGAHCADVTVYKPAPGAATTYIFSQGYDVPCTTIADPTASRFVSRGLVARY